MKRIVMSKDRQQRKGSGRRSRTRTDSKAGRYVRSTMQRKNNDLAFDATLRAAAPYQSIREKNGLAFAIKSQDIREKIREKRIGNFVVFAVDASGSMGAQQRMVATKGAILSFLMDAYQKRDEISLIAFKGKEAEVLLPPTSSVELAHRLLEQLPTGGKTPLPHGLTSAYELIKQNLRKDDNIYPLLVLISDGKANVSMGDKKPLEEAREMALRFKEQGIRSLVIDVEKSNFISFGLAKDLADTMGAKYYKLEDLQVNNIVGAVQEALNF